MNRREFLKSAALVTAAGAMFGKGSVLEAAESPVAKPEKKIRNFNPQMRYRPCGRNNIMLSALGFGTLRLATLSDGKTLNEKLGIELIRRAIDNGVNYIDSANVYWSGQSETIVGKALQGDYRERTYITSKAHWERINSPDDLEKIFDESRKRMRTDVIDFYHIHMLTYRGWNDKVLPLRLIERMEKLKSQGKIRFSGFSFHDNFPLFKRIVDANPDWNFCLLQHNYLDFEHEGGVMALKYAASRGMGVSIMEPLRRGFLVNPPKEMRAILDSAQVKRSPVEWAFDYLWNMPEVSVAVCGMSAMEHVEENVSYARRSAAGMFNADDNQIMGDVLRKFRTYPKSIPCTGCDLCIPCPHNVAIGYIFSYIYNRYAANGDLEGAKRNYFSNMSPRSRGDKASACVNCNQCLAKCPEKINIPAMLKRVKAELES